MPTPLTRAPKKAQPTRLSGGLAPDTYSSTQEPQRAKLPNESTRTYALRHGSKHASTTLGSRGIGPSRGHEMRVGSENTSTIPAPLLHAAAPPLSASVSEVGITRFHTHHAT